MRVGIDIGGTTVKIGFVEDKIIVDSYAIPTKKETLFDDIFTSILEYQKKHKIDIEFIGLGIPGNVIDNYIVNMPNIGLKDIDLNQILPLYFSVPFASDNDANVAALGEATYDNRYKSSYMITLGTGVGGGLVLDGKVICGAHAACGEIGHMFVDYKHEYSCTCGLKGCLETVASATGMVRLCKEYQNEYKTKLKISDVLTAKDICDAAKEEDELALYVLNEVSRYLARGLATLAVAVDVDVFYIGGGVAACGDLLFQRIRTYYQEYAHYAVKNTKIEPAKLKNQAGILGAAYLK